MKRFITSLFTFFLFSQLFAQTISIQGVLRDPNGRSVEDGFYSVTFKIYDTSEGGISLWEDTYADLETRHGVFQANLGEQTSLDGLGFDTEYFVGVTVENFSEISPRIPLTIYPYSKAILGQENKFPSVGNVELLRDSIIIHQGALRLLGDDGVIMFNDGTTLNTAEFGGPAASLLNPTSISINADKDDLGTGNINFQIAANNRMSLQNSGTLEIYGQSDNPFPFFTTSDHTGQTGLVLGNSTSTSNWEIAVGGSGSGIGSGSFYLFDRENALARMSINQAGAVGFNNTNPLASLHLGTDDAGVSSLRLSGDGAGSSEGGEIQIMTSADFDDVVDYWYMDGFEDDLRIGGLGVGDVMRVTAEGGVNLGFGDVMRVVSGGNVGIGISTPLVPLHVSSGTNLSLAGGGSTVIGELSGLNMGFSSSEIQVRNNGAVSDLLLNEEGGNVVIGNNGANTSLHLGSVDANGASLLVINGGGTGDTEGGEIQLHAADDHDDTNNYWFIDAFEDDFRIGAVGTNHDAFRVTSNGNVGLSDNTPVEAKLVVRGSEPMDIAYGFLNGAGNIGFIPANGLDAAYSIWADNRIVCAELNAFSDARIKDVVSVSNTFEDLETLYKLKITDYKYIDKIGKGNKTHKKLIAQEVQEVFPQAVSQTTDFVPNVYEIAQNVQFNSELNRLMITTSKEHGFEVGDHVRLIASDGALDIEILEALDKNNFSFASEKPYDEIFVYGKEVDDFRTVDYEAISMLNVSATQELIKRVEKLNEKLEAVEKENALLKSKLDKVELLEAKLNELIRSQDRSVSAKQADTTKK